MQVGKSLLEISSDPKDAKVRLLLYERCCESETIPRGDARKAILMLRRDILMGGGGEGRGWEWREGGVNGGRGGGVERVWG